MTGEGSFHDDAGLQWWRGGKSRYRYTDGLFKQQVRLSTTTTARRGGKEEPVYLGMRSPVIFGISLPEAKLKG
jgi:hypothetical protein